MLSDYARMISGTSWPPTFEHMIRELSGKCKWGVFIVGLTIVFIHYRHQTLGEEAEDSFAHPWYDLGNDLFLIGSKVTEHIGNNIGFTDLSRASGDSWSPDAYPNTDEIATAQLGNDGINPFVPARAATLANTDFTQSEVKVVMNDKEIIKVDIEFFNQPADRLTAPVHKSLGLGDYYFIAGHHTHANSCLTLLFVKAEAVRPGKMIEADKADIMTVISVAPPRITQAYNQIHRNYFKPYPLCPLPLDKGKGKSLVRGTSSLLHKSFPLSLRRGGHRG